MQSFIFGKGQQYASPEELAKARALAEAMLGPRRAPQNVSEGMTALGQAIRGRMDMSGINKAEAAGRESASSAVAKALGGFGGEGAPSAPGGVSAALTGGGSTGSAGGNSEIEAYIRQAAQQRGIDPEIALRVAKSEGGFSDPFQQSNIVKNGQREQSYGPFQLYMGGGMGNDALAAGIDPRKDWQGGVNFALDQAKEKGWGPWYGAKAVGVNGMEGIGGAPQQVASLDPSIGMPQEQPSVAAALKGPQAAQIAQNNPGNIGMPDGSVAQGAFPPPPPVQTAQAGPDLNTLLEAAKNPWLNEQERALVNMLLEQKMQQQDPAHQLDMEYKRAQIDALGVKDEQWQKLDDDTLFNKSGETKELGAGVSAPKFDDISGLRKEIQALPSYKNLAQAAPIYKSMAETAGRNSRASDLNLVYGLGKIMDPTSVVREGEMVMVKNTASLPDWLQGAINSLNGGAALTAETRKAILTEAYGRVKGYQDAFGQDSGQYQGIVERNRMNPADVIPDFGEMKPWEPPADGEPAAPQSDEEYNALPSGALFVDPDDGKTYRKP